MRREHLIQYLAAVVLVVCAVVWFSAMGKVRTAHALLADGNRELEQAKQTLKELQVFAAKERAANKPALTDSEVLELARLRSEVTRLRNDQRAATNKPPIRQAAPDTAQVTTTPPPGIMKISSTTTANVPLGHALVLGGWASPEPGKRIVTFITPETVLEAPGSIMVQTRLMSVPDALLDQFGLRAVRDAAAGRGPLSFNVEQFQTLLKAMEQTDGVDVLSAPRVLTRSGQAAKVSVTQAQPDGTITGPVFGLTPTLDATGTSVQLDVDFELNLPAAKP